MDHSTEFADVGTCVADLLEVTAIKVDKDTFFASGDIRPLDFRIDIVDSATGSAKLTVVLAEDIQGNPVQVEITRCCRPDGLGGRVDCETGQPGGTCDF